MELNDATLFNYAVNASYAVNTQVYETIYDDIIYPDLVTVNTNYPEMAAGYTRLVGTQVGRADWVSGYAKDIPFADVGLESVSASFAMFASAYKWNVEELGVAQFANFPLTARKAVAVRRAAEEFTQNIVLFGNAAKGWTGLINNGAVTPAPAGALWSGATPEQIVADLNTLLMGPATVAGTPGATMANTILLPPEAYRLIATTPYGVTSPGETVLTYFQKTNLYTDRTGQPIMIREVAQLADAATVGVVGGGRAVGYRNSPEVVELPMPLPFRFEPVHREGPLHYEVPGIARVGELDVMIPGALRYIDGITAA